MGNLQKEARVPYTIENIKQEVRSSVIDNVKEIEELVISITSHTSDCEGKLGLGLCGELSYASDDTVRGHLDNIKHNLNDLRLRLENISSNL